MNKALALAFLASLLFNVWAIYATGKMQTVMAELSNGHAEAYEELMSCKAELLDATRMRLMCENELTFCLQTIEAQSLGTK